MYDFKIIASKKQSELLREIICNANCREEDDADIVLVESGHPIPVNGFAIVFNPDDVVQLIRFINEITGQRKGPQVLIGRKHETFEPLRLEDILFFKAAGNNLFAHTAAKTYEMKQKLYEMEKLISKDNFIRVNRSNIVNILKIKEIIPWFGGRILLRFTGSEERIEVSRNYVKDFKQFLDM